MEMDVYDHESYQMSISNLIMLKLFHDEGVNVQNFSDFMVHINYQLSSSTEIFWDGVRQLFNEVHYYGYGEEHNIDEFCNQFKALFDEDKNLTPEYVFTFQDDLFKEVLKGPYSAQFKEVIPSLDHLEACDVELVVLPGNEGLAFLCYFATHLHDVVRTIIKLKKEAIKFINLHEKERENGYTNQLLNRKTA